MTDSPKGRFVKGPVRQTLLLPVSLRPRLPSPTVAVYGFRGLGFRVLVLGLSVGVEGLFAVGGVGLRAQ
eukprot:2029740-Alexandrium_andersonii.AAC.1